MLVHHVDSAQYKTRIRLEFVVAEKVHQMIAMQSHFIRHALLLFRHNRDHRHNPIAAHLKLFDAPLDLSRQRLTQDHRLLRIVFGQILCSLYFLLHGAVNETRQLIHQDDGRVVELQRLLRWPIDCRTLAAFHKILFLFGHPENRLRIMHFIGSLSAN